METIALVNPNGGVGKSTTTVNLGAGLVRQGKRVLLVDADPQANLTQMLGWQQPEGLDVTLSSFVEAFVGDRPLPWQEGILHSGEGTYTGKDGKTHTNFDVQKVFDISQTNAVPRETVLDVRQSLQALLTRPVCPVQVLERSGGAVYVPEGNRVEIGRGLSVEETFRTLSMAFAHGELAKRIPDYRPNDPQNNLYARCISCVVCTRYGVDTRDYNFMDAPNVLGGCNNQELRQHLTVIRDTANLIVERTDKVRKSLLSRQTRTTEQGAR